MNRRGFALITVLWLTTVLATAVGLGMAAQRTGNAASGNRLVLVRGRWAAEACLAIAQARWSASRFTDTATIDLGRETVCRWTADDPTARLNINMVDVAVLEKLQAVIGSRGSAPDSFVAGVVKHRQERPFEDLREVVDLLGSDSAVLSQLTVDGPGTVNLSTAPPQILRTLPGLSAEAVEAIGQARALHRPVTSLDALAASLSPGGRAALLANYADLSRLVTFTSPVLRLTAEGWVTGIGGPEGLHATIEVLLVPLPDRLATVRRRMW